MKKIITLLITIVMCFSLCSCGTNSTSLTLDNYTDYLDVSGTYSMGGDPYKVDIENTFPVKLNGESVNIEGYNIDGNTYFKLRDVSSVVGGFDVDFQHNMIQLSKDGYVFDNTNMQDYIIASEDIVSASNICEIDGKVYVSSDVYANGGSLYEKGNIDIYQLPQSMQAVDDTIYRFCLYNERIYFLAGEDGTDTLIAKIYSCNKDGSDIQMVVDNASNQSVFYLFDDTMYYDAYYWVDFSDGFSMIMPDGIYGFNITNHDKIEIVDGDNVDGNWLELMKCDTNNMYYKIRGNSREQYYSINYNGQHKKELNADDERFSYNLDNRRYFIKENKLYSKVLGDESSVKEICTVPYVRDDYSSDIRYQNSSIEYIDENYLYYSVYTAYNNKSYGDKFIYRIEVEQTDNIDVPQNKFPIQLNGNNVEIKGYNISGNTYFKLRDIADTVGGFNVDFADNTILLSNKNC